MHRHSCGPRALFCCALDQCRVVSWSNAGFLSPSCTPALGQSKSLVPAGQRRRLEESSEQKQSLPCRLLSGWRILPSVRMAPGKSNSSPSRKLRSGNGNGSGRKSSSCCGPSMRLVIVCLSLAIVCVSIVAFLVVDVPRVHLNDYVLPSKHLHAQGLKNTGKLKWNKTCDGFGVRQDFFFPKYGGKACGQSFWEASTDLVDEEPPIQKAQLVYKIFTTNESAQEYFEKFWGRHLYDRLPPYLYTEVEKVISERVGDDRTAYFWHPKLVSAGVPVPLQAARVPLHVIFIFR